ncbi:MAG: hypothetical protein LBE56_11305 [Tannerella sp.]|jgi:hypothetical protein|nr:hypothetical protein [Tannerella sp.]
MNKKDTNIHLLLERFFEGQTGISEEQELFRFFGQDDGIPEDLLPYKPVIQYFERGLADELSGSKNSDELDSAIIENGQATSPSGRKKSSVAFFTTKSRRTWSYVAAASILIIMVSTLYFLLSADPYEGSYIIRNGERITDLKLIRPELIVTEQLVLAQLHEAEQSLEEMDDMDNDLENQMMEQIEAYNQQFIQNLENENSRNEAAEIFKDNN